MAFRHPLGRGLGANAVCLYGSGGAHIDRRLRRPSDADAEADRLGLVQALKERVSPYIRTVGRVKH
jgi:hypothetical protein